MKITIPYHLSIKYMSLHHGHKTYLLAKQQLNILPNIISFFIPTSKHLRRRQWGQKRRVRTSIRQSFWKRHFGCWKKMHIFFNVEISIVQIVNKLSPCKFYSQLLKKHQIWKKYVTPGISNLSNLFILHFITYKCKCCWRILLKKRRIYHLIFIITETKNIYLYIY